MAYTPQRPIYTEIRGSVVKLGLNLDGFFNGDEFEATLRELIDEHEADTKERIVQAFQSKAQNTDRVIAADFRLRDISNTARGR